MLAGFIALSSVAMITSIGTGVNNVYTAVNEAVAGIGGGGEAPGIPPITPP